MKLSSLTTALLFTLAISPVVMAEVYKVVDKEGKVTYTDKPPAPGTGNPVNLPPINTRPGIEPPPPEEQIPAAEISEYRRVAIVQPQAGITIPPGQLDLVIQVGIEPALQPGHLVEILMNGRSLGRPAAATSMRIENLERGTHRIEAIIINAEGRRIAASQSVEFFVKRASRLNQH